MGGTKRHGLTYEGRSIAYRVCSNIGGSVGAVGKLFSRDRIVGVDFAGVATGFKDLRLGLGEV